MTCYVCFFSADAVRMWFIIILPRMIMQSNPSMWEARCKTWLLIKVTPKGVVFFLFFSEQAKTEPCQAEGR